MSQKLAELSSPYRILKLIGQIPILWMLQRRWRKRISKLNVKMFHKLNLGTAIALIKKNAISGIAAQLMALGELKLILI